MPNKAIKYRLYPTDEQKTLFAKTFGCCRKVYNLMLADKIKSYKTTGKFANAAPAMYKKDYPYLKEVDSLALASKYLDLQKAFRNCFDKSRKAGANFPRFKSAKHSRKSYTTYNQKGTVALLDGCIKLPKAGKVSAVIHRLPENGWLLKSATISQDPDGKYYASVLFEYDSPESGYAADLNKAIGLDYASDGLFTDSDGHKGSNHKYFQESQRKLARAQRKLSRKNGSRKGETESANHRKQRLKVAKIHKHIANQRLDNLHKLSTEIANQYDIVCVESLDMRAMANRGFHNGKSTMDNGYGMFLSMLEYKLADRNKLFVKVDKWYPSSQLCHRCGQRHPEMKDLRLRVMSCSCGLTMDRDQNAAINILQEGQRLLSQPA